MQNTDFKTLVLKFIASHGYKPQHSDIKQFSRPYVLCKLMACLDIQLRYARVRII